MATFEGKKLKKIAPAAPKNFPLWGGKFTHIFKGGGKRIQLLVRIYSPVSIRFSHNSSPYWFFLPFPFYPFHYFSQHFCNDKLENIFPWEKDLAPFCPTCLVFDWTDLIFSNIYLFIIKKSIKSLKKYLCAGDIAILCSEGN